MSRASSWTRVFVCHLAAVAAGAHAAAAQEGESAEMEELARAIHTSAFTALPAALQLPQPTRAFAVNVDSTALHWSSTWLDDRSQMAAASMGTPAASIEGSVEASGIPTAEELLAAYQVCQGAADRPRTLSDLTGGYQLYQSSYREDFAASLGLLGIADLSGRRSAIVVRYHLFRMVRRSCSINSVEIPVVWGVGVASTLHVKEARRGARVTSLPVIAASVEFGHASVTMRMETAGLVGAAIEQAFPRASIVDFNVQAYGDWAVALDKIRGLMSDPTVTATPQLLITEEALPAISRAFAAVQRE